MPLWRINLRSDPSFSRERIRKTSRFSRRQNQMPRRQPATGKKECRGLDYANEGQLKYRVHASLYSAMIYTDTCTCVCSRTIATNVIAIRIPASHLVPLFLPSFLVVPVEKRHSRMRGTRRTFNRCSFGQPRELPLQLAVQRGNREKRKREDDRCTYLVARIRSTRIQYVIVDPSLVRGMKISRKVTEVEVTRLERFSQ